MNKWEDYYTPRQNLALVTLVRLVRKVGDILASESDKSFAVAVETCLGLAVGKQADSNSSICSWRSVSQDIGHTFGRQAIPMMWDFVEANILSGATRDWSNAVEGGLKALQSLDPDIHSGQVQQANASEHPLSNNFAQAFVTDPPYYYSVQYADLSDYFYVWLRRMLKNAHPDLFKTPLTPKEDEIIVQSPRHVSAPDGKNTVFYESRMKKAMSEGRRILTSSGIGVVVFAHTSTSGWEAQLQAMIDAGWIITGSWPIDTEMASRVIAQNRAVLASSVHLICRPRQINEIGDWREVLQELPHRIHAWLPRLAQEGVVGADAIFACLGPALEIFSRYASVEKASGEPVPLGEYLEHVWAAISKEALNMVFAGADTTGFEEDARLTAIWLWTLTAGKDELGIMNYEAGGESDDEEDNGKGKGKGKSSAGYVLEYDAARKISQGLGAHLEQLSHLVEIKGENARLLPVLERGRFLFGKANFQAEKPGPARRPPTQQLSLFELLPPEDKSEWGLTEQITPPPGQTTLDKIHQSMLLFAAGRSDALKQFLVHNGVGQDERFWRLAQALSALYPSHTDEKRWVDGVLARKKSLGF